MLLHQGVERDVIPVYPLRKKVPREREPILRLAMTNGSAGDVPGAKGLGFDELNGH